MHTPGPWKYNKSTLGGDWVISTADHTTLIAREVRHFNAPLITAAPEFLEASVHLPQPKSLLADAAYTGGDLPKKWINDRGHYNDGYNQCLKDVALHFEPAIAKATGI